MPPPPPPSGAPPFSSDPPPPSYDDAVASFGMAAPPPPPMYGDPEMSNVPPPPPPSMSSLGQDYPPPPAPPQELYPQFNPPAPVPAPAPAPAPATIAPEPVVTSATVAPDPVVTSAAVVPPSSSVVPPVPQSSMGGYGASSSGASLEGKKLMFVATKNVVICRDFSDPTKGSVEVWRHEVSESHGSYSHPSHIRIVFCAGLVIVRYVTSLIALDALSGSVRWKLTLEKEGECSFCNMVVNGFMVYIGLKTVVLAVSVLEGTINWMYKFSDTARCALPTVVHCGMALFVAGGRECASVNTADGTVLWRKKLDGGSSTFPPAGVWDGKNHVLLGTCCNIVPIDIRNGSEGSKVHLKDNFKQAVCLVHDKYRHVFYALTCNALFAISDDDDYRIIWRVDLKLPGYNGCANSLALEPETGRIYAVMVSTVVCVGVDGSLLFQKKFDEPYMSKYSYSTTLDLLDSGRLFIASNGFFIAVDSEGNKIESDQLKGLGYNATTICTPTASPDPSASCDMSHRFVKNNSVN